MKKTTAFLSAFALLLTISLHGCKNDQIKHPETQEVKDLKEYFAITAKVDVNSINYDESKDEFSINGTAKISRTKLLIFYGFYKNPTKTTMINHTSSNNK